MKQIIIEIDENGNVELETKGFNGPICLKESEFIKKALGEELEHNLTPCYFNSTGVSETVTRKLKPFCG